MQNQTNLLITFDTQLKTAITLQKHEGLYQNRVTGSLASILRPGNLATTVKWSTLAFHTGPWPMNSKLEI